MLWELVPPGSVPSRPLREGEAFLKATAPRDGAKTRMGRGDSSARAVPLRAGTSVQVPPKNSVCPSSELIPCHAACPCPAPGPRSLPSRGPAGLRSTGESGSERAQRAQITPKITPKRAVAAPAGQLRRGEEKTRPSVGGGLWEALVQPLLSLTRALGRREVVAAGGEGDTVAFS